MFDTKEELSKIVAGDVAILLGISPREAEGTSVSKENRELIAECLDIEYKAKEGLTPFPEFIDELWASHLEEQVGEICSDLIEHL